MLEWYRSRRRCSRIKRKFERMAKVKKRFRSHFLISVKHTGLIGGHHVFDIYEGVFSSVALKHLQSLLDQVADVLPLVLAVVDAVSGVDWRERTNRTSSALAIQPVVVQQSTAGKCLLSV